METIKSRIGLDNSDFFSGVVTAVEKVDILKQRVKDASKNVDIFSAKKAEKIISLKDDVSEPLQEVSDDVKDFSKESAVKEISVKDSASAEIHKVIREAENFSREEAVKEVSIKDSASPALENIKKVSETAFNNIKKNADDSIVYAVKTTEEGVAAIRKDLNSLGKLAVNPKVDFKSFKNIVNSQLRSDFSNLSVPVKAKIHRIESGLKGLGYAPKNAVVSLKARLDNTAFVQGVQRTRQSANSLIAQLKKAAYLKVAPVAVLKDMVSPKARAIASTVKSRLAKPFHAAVGIKDAVSGKVGQIKGKLNALKAKVSPAVSLKDSATAKIGNIKAKMSGLGKMAMKPALFIKDNFSKIKSGLKQIGSMLTSLPALAGVALAGLGVKDMLQSGMKLEQQEISIKHFMGIGNKDKDADTIKKMSDEYVAYLRNNANLTPFTTDEVIAAGTRSLTVSNGDLTAAKGMLKVAEDMAALNPEKSLKDAMEALADLNVGETERMKEFGFKISADDIKGKGMDQIMKEINAQFTGGAEKLSASGAGVWSTITGKLGSIKTDLGSNLLTGAKPALDMFSSWLTENEGTIGAWASKIGDGFSKGVRFLTDNVGKAKTVIDLFKDRIGTIGDKVSGVIGWFSAWKNRSGDTVEGIKSNLAGLGSSFEGMTENWKGLIDGFGVFWQAHGDGIIEALSNTFGLITSIVQGGLDLISEVFKTVGDILRGDWNAVWDDLHGIATKFWDNIKKVFEKGKEWIGSIFDLFTGNKKDSGSKSASKTEGVSGSYAVGIKRLPNDQIAQVHKDEAIIPAKYNPWNPNNSLKSESRPLENHSLPQREVTEKIISTTRSNQGISVQINNINIEIPLQANGQIDFKALETRVSESVLRALIAAVENMGGVYPV